MKRVLAAAKNEIPVAKVASPRLAVKTSNRCFDQQPAERQTIGGVSTA
jgi:hypothetical protein